jgi:hypothetical protein
VVGECVAHRCPGRGRECVTRCCHGGGVVVVVAAWWRRCGRGEEGGGDRTRPRQAPCTIVAPHAAGLSSYSRSRRIPRAMKEKVWSTATARLSGGPELANMPTCIQGCSRAVGAGAQTHPKP